MEGIQELGEASQANRGRSGEVNVSWDHIWERREKWARASPLMLGAEGEEDRDR